MTFLNLTNQIIRWTDEFAQLIAHPEKLHAEVKKTLSFADGSNLSSYSPDMRRELSQLAKLKYFLFYELAKSEGVDLPEHLILNTQAQIFSDLVLDSKFS